MSRVNADGVAIEYQVTGQGKPVILLHGFPDSGRLWRHQVPALATAGFQVIVPDLRGYGNSGKPEAVDAYSLAVLAADVKAVLADLDITSCLLYTSQALQVLNRHQHGRRPPVNSDGPVSYTHLDVYKRQRPARPAERHVSSLRPTLTTHLQRNAA